ncbi:hypothetical protein DFH05DRAFT_1464579, partial [Lentinula detonsa]
NQYHNLKTNLQSSPEPLQPPVMREIVLSPGTIGRLQEFDEFLASLPPDSPAPHTFHGWLFRSRRIVGRQISFEKVSSSAKDFANCPNPSKVANQSSFVLNPDSPLAPRSQKKHNNAQSHGTSDLGKSGSLLKNSLNNVPVFMPSGSKIKTTHLPPASKSDVLQNSSVSAESNDIQPQPASPLPHITDAHVSQSSESANSSGALGPNQQASESVPQLKTNLQSSPEPLRPPVMREIVLSPGAIGRLQEFDEFLASLPPDSPTPPSLPRVALQFFGMLHTLEPFPKLSQETVGFRRFYPAVPSIILAVSSSSQKRGKAADGGARSRRLQMVHKRKHGRRRGLDESTFESRYSEAPPDSDSDPKSSSRQIYMNKRMLNEAIEAIQDSQETYSIPKSDAEYWDVKGVYY